MNVISKRGLLDLAASHPETLATLTIWHERVRRASWHGLNEVRRDFPSADQVGDVLLFNVMGCNYRLERFRSFRSPLPHGRCSVPSRARQQAVVFANGENALVTTVAYQVQRIYVKALLTHREYERKEWMKWV